MSAPLVDERIRAMALRLEQAQRIAADLVRHVGTEGFCRWCGAKIFWVRHLDTKKNAPYDPTGLNHWATCPNAKEHRHERPSNTNAAAE